MAEKKEQSADQTNGTYGLVVSTNGHRPPSASQREVLRAELPAVYQDSDFGMRFIASLETLLDPIVGMLDALPAYFTPDLAPTDLIDLMLSWLGVEAQEGLSLDARRMLVREAAELSRGRGTKQGLELALKLTFPDTPLRVEDQGGVSWSLNPEEIPSAKASDFVVYCDKPLQEEQMMEVARAIDHYKPVHTRYRLRVKAPRKQAQK